MPGFETMRDFQIYWGYMSMVIIQVGSITLLKMKTVSLMDGKLKGIR